MSLGHVNPDWGHPPCKLPSTHPSFTHRKLQAFGIIGQTPPDWAWGGAGQAACGAVKIGAWARGT